MEKDSKATNKMQTVEDLKQPYFSQNPSKIKLSYRRKTKNYRDSRENSNKEVEYSDHSFENLSKDDKSIQVKSASWKNSAKTKISKTKRSKKYPNCLKFSKSCEKLTAQHVNKTTTSDFRPGVLYSAVVVSGVDNSTEHWSDLANSEIIDEDCVIAEKTPKNLITMMDNENYVAAGNLISTEFEKLNTKTSIECEIIQSSEYESKNIKNSSNQVMLPKPDLSYFTDLRRLNEIVAESYNKVVWAVLPPPVQIQEKISRNILFGIDITE